MLMLKSVYCLLTSDLPIIIGNGASINYIKTLMALKSPHCTWLPYLNTGGSCTGLHAAFWCYGITGKIRPQCTRSTTPNRIRHVLIIYLLLEKGGWILGSHLLLGLRFGEPGSQGQADPRGTRERWWKQRGVQGRKAPMDARLQAKRSC